MKRILLFLIKAFIFIFVISFFVFMMFIIPCIAGYGFLYYFKKINIIIDAITMVKMWGLGSLIILLIIAISFYIIFFIQSIFKGLIYIYEDISIIFDDIFKK